MGRGLGKNSPVVLTLGKENYEALISRHGQWVRWRVATKCPCVKPETMQPDIHCAACGGLGVTYGYQASEIVTSQVMVKDATGVIELESDYEDAKLIKCYDNSGALYDAAQKRGCYVLLNADEAPCKGVYVTAVMTQSTLKTLDAAECEKLGAGYYRVNGLRASKNDIDGLYHTAPCDIESIGAIKDAAGVEYKAREYRQDCFYIEAEESEDGTVAEISEPVTVESVKYIPPFTFVLLNQNLTKSDERVMQELNGDAVLTAPYSCDVAGDDVVTVLSGTYTQKSVLARKAAEYDVLPSYFAQEVSECVGRNRRYYQGEDFLLLGTNYIKWLCADAPEAGEAYAVTYKVYPTYKVVKAIPQIRTSENQRMPKKAIVKLYDVYGEKRGFNRQ